MNEILEFEAWLKELNQKLEQSSPAARWEILAQEIENRYRVKVWFVQIFGKRWAYIAGQGSDYPLAPLQQIRLSPKYAMVYAGGEIPEKEKNSLIDFLRNYKAGVTPE